MGRRELLVCSLLALSGCAAAGGGGSAGSEAKPAPPAKQKKSRLTRYSFADAPSNQKTGGVLQTEKNPTVLVDAQGQEVPLANYLGERPLVLVFMRGFAGFVCPYCTTYTAQLAARYRELQEAGAQVVVVYPTREEDQARIDEFVAACNEILAEEGAEALPFPVLLDPGIKAVKKYRLEWDLSRPSTFVLDGEGTIRYAYVGKKSSDRPSVDRILAEVIALKEKG